MTARIPPELENLDAKSSPDRSGTVAALRFAVVLLLLGACSLRDKPSPVLPADPLPADPPIELGSMDAECDGLIAALTDYKACKNLEPDDVETIDAWIEVANRNLAAGKKGNPEPNAQKAIAGACHRAAGSIKAAHQRCLAGPKPKA